jgi:hypothetical protein
MKNIILFALLVIALQVNGQVYLGAHSSNYDPIKAGMFNPASPATSYMKWEVNVFSVDLSAAQDYLKLVGGISEWVSDFDQDVNVVENLNGESKTGNVTTDFQALGFMLSTKKAGTFNFGTRVRAIVDANNIEENFLSSMYNDANNIYNWAEAINDDNLSLNAHVFGEMAIGYSRYVLKKEKHALSAGGTVKLMMPIFSGVANGNVDIAIDTDAETANFGSTQFNAVSSDMINLVDDDYNYKFKISGFGLDFGAVYEWKTGKGSQKVMGKNKDKVKLNPDYFLKAGFAVLDIGRVKYNHSNYSRIFNSDGNTVSLETITQDDSTFIDFDDVLNAVGSFEEFEGSFSTKLPTAISLFADVKLTRGIYVNASTIINLGSFKPDAPKARIQNVYSITPRFELPMVGVYLPFSYNNFNGFQMGTSVRFSNFVIGSSNIFSSLWKKEASSIDLQFAMAFGGLDKSKKKQTEKLLEEGSGGN